LISTSVATRLPIETTARASSSFPVTVPAGPKPYRRLGNKEPAKVQTNTLNSKRMIASGFQALADNMAPS
jgi:hypothetical protein